jgi:hypothetical protein
MQTPRPCEACTAGSTSLAIFPADLACALALAKPANVRSTIKALSNSPKIAIIPNSAPPAGVLVTMASRFRTMDFRSAGRLTLGACSVGWFEVRVGPSERQRQHLTPGKYPLDLFPAPFLDAYPQLRFRHRAILLALGRSNAALLDARFRVILPGETRCAPLGARVGAARA